MAYGQFSAILTAVREVLDDGGGSLRTISAGRFTSDLTEGLSDEEQRRRGVRSDKPFRVAFTRMERHPASPPITGNLIMYAVEMEVVVSRTVGPLEQVDLDAMATLRALAFEDADVIRQALCTPPNLAETAASVSTDLAGDSLQYENTRLRVVGDADGGAQHLETIHTLSGVVISRPG